MEWHKFIGVLSKIASIMSLITKLLKKFKVFEWTIECQNVWEEIKNQYIQVASLISPN
jgi:hypothetical protein